MLHPLTILIALSAFSQITVGLNCTGDEDGGCQEVVCPGDSEPLSPEGGCKCVPARCHEPPPCPSGVKSTLKKKASLKPGDCCDVFECPPITEDVDCNRVVCPEEEPGELCPADSYKLPAVQRDGECCSQSQGCACLPAPCPVPVCPNASQLTVLAKGDGRPGSCCPIYQCTSHTGTNRTCIVDGKAIHDGGKWSPNKCSVCSCDKGLMLCASVTECPSLPDDCEDTITPPDSCCPICANDNTIESIDTNGCWLANGTFKENGSTWDMDDCTNCTCIDGKRKCHATLCLSPCLNATVVKGKCCPVCNGSTDFVLPQHCPLLNNCSLKCKDGFARDESNCFFCQCKVTSLNVGPFPILVTGEEEEEEEEEEEGEILSESFDIEDPSNNLNSSSSSVDFELPLNYTSYYVSSGEGSEISNLTDSVDFKLLSNFSSYLSSELTFNYESVKDVPNSNMTSTHFTDSTFNPSTSFSEEFYRMKLTFLQKEHYLKMKVLQEEFDFWKERKSFLHLKCECVS